MIRFFSCCLLVVAALAQNGPIVNSNSASSSAAVKQEVLWQKLASSINDVDHNLDGVLGVAVLDLSSGKKFVLRGDEVFPQASSIKTALLAELYRQAQIGKLKLTDLYTMQAADLVPDSSSWDSYASRDVPKTNRKLWI